MFDIFAQPTLESCSLNFWPKDVNEAQKLNELEVPCPSEQPYSVYHLEQPHKIRQRYGHLGASPFCRSSAMDSMELLRNVLQPAINHDIVDIFKKYVAVFKKAAENASENMNQGPFQTCQPLDITDLVSSTCKNSLEHAKSLFKVKEGKCGRAKSQHGNIMIESNITNSDQSGLSGKPRAASPDFPWNKRLKDDLDASRRSLSPVPRKKARSSTPTTSSRGYSSPHRQLKGEIRRKIESWDPSRLTLNTNFVMGTKANRALGLGATRGRIYMKHPELFKYAGDHEDKKWMVKNNCMAATGGKNTFIMVAEDVMNLYETEYKNSPGTMPDELQFFKLPEFVLQKMRDAMMADKLSRIGRMNAEKKGNAQFSPLRIVMSPSKNEKKPIMKTPEKIRHVAQLAAATIDHAPTCQEYRSLSNHPCLPSTAQQLFVGSRSEADEPILDVGENNNSFDDGDQ